MVGRVTQIFDNYGYLIFENSGGGDLTVGSTVYVRGGGGSVSEFKVSRMAGSLVSATPVSGMGNAAKGSDVLQRVR